MWVIGAPSSNLMSANTLLPLVTVALMLRCQGIVYAIARKPMGGVLYLSFISVDCLNHYPGVVPTNDHQALRLAKTL